MTPIGIVGTSGGFAGLVLPLSKYLVTGIPRLIGSSQEKEYPSLTVRACDGLSWDTPARFELSKAVPVVMGRWEFVIGAKVSCLSMRWWLSFWRKSTLTMRL